MSYTKSSTVYNLYLTTESFHAAGQPLERGTVYNFYAATLPSERVNFSGDLDKTVAMPSKQTYIPSALYSIS